MTLSPFTLTYHPQRVTQAVRDSWIDELRDVDAQLAQDFERIPSRLQRSLASTLLSYATDGAPEAFARLRRVVRELTRAGRVVTVGLWDMGAGVGFLPEIIEALNDAQDRFCLFEVVAPTPAGIVSRPERVTAWAAERRLRSVAPDEIGNNVIDADFFSHAAPIQETLGVNYLVGLVPSMIAGEDGDEVFWNHFSNTSRHMVLASTYGLRAYAAEAERPFEVAVANVALAALLVAASPKLDYHDDRGCLFDYNGSRVSIIKSIRESRIEASCLALIPPSFRDAAEAFVSVLATFTPATARERKHRAASRHLVDARASAAEAPLPTPSAPPEVSERASRAARLLVRLLAHRAFRGRPELAIVAVAEAEDLPLLDVPMRALKTLVHLLATEDTAARSRAEAVAASTIDAALQGAK